MKMMDSRECAWYCAGYALQKKGYDIRILKIAGLSDLADYLVFASGDSDRQVQAIAEAVRMGLKRKKRPAFAVDGMREGRWVLLDYGDVMVHVFQKAVREFYDLEGMWSEAPELPLPPDSWFEAAVAPKP